MADEYAYTDLGVAVRKDEAAGVYEFGVILDGGFVVLAARKAGGVEKQLRLAQERQAESDRQAAAQPPQPPAQ